MDELGLGGLELGQQAGELLVLVFELDVPEAVDLGFAPAALDFEASYGRTTLEYYDGFVFGFYAEGRPEMPLGTTGPGRVARPTPTGRGS